ncbi:MAG: hypothetical protein UY33_C0030G0006 [Candidatus Amesbacteria bacterium GW2011_GWA1_48_9]|uniref:Uncharacterized protein n=2 Tax=Candidatus Amesiibacteriota TaxID=1752730 RepID=A0A0G1UJR9_9BACT|nr:MAG: hypothetical protein UY22_C0014G0021 [Candidatus Amesbacteria bacterium GW2011_GWC1_48_10]KKU99495.1 MAG: hypothetical protein UY33_C0030G0006 [Candidatus Amesbacteria bacterium GW2011_GWA1_48_9]
MVSECSWDAEDIKLGYGKNGGGTAWVAETGVPDGKID